MKRWAEIWSSFPSEHKRRFWQGVGSYALLCVVVAVWVSFQSKNTLESWHSRIPSASAVIKPASLTPQTTTDVPQFIESTSTKDPREHVTKDVAVPIPVRNLQTYDDGRIYVSVIISGLGLSAPLTEQALAELPKGVNLAFSPYAENISEWMKTAAKMNHETLIFMPMESATYPKDDPGPRALSSRLADQDNEDNLNWVLSQGKGSAGVINLMGSRFLTDRKRLSPVFDKLRKRDALFVEIPGTDNSAAKELASQNGLPYLSVDLKIDNSLAESDMRRQLATLEKMAKERGFAIAIVDPYPLTFSVLKSWAAGLPAHGISLAPLSTVWKNKPHYDGTFQPPQEQLRRP